MDKKPIGEITKEGLKKYTHHLTVGLLLEFIKKYNVPEDALILTQRIEDFYFENNHWDVYLKEGYQCHSMREFNNKIDSGLFDDSEQYPGMTEDLKKKWSDDDIKSAMEQYHPVWSPVYYKDDKDILFLDIHY